ncbi:MAG: hypothetical protein KA765_05810 [Thermoflexales bacterium]|nr:hypothetical protein [Thermoflexales bacterium]
MANKIIRLFLIMLTRGVAGALAGLIFGVVSGIVAALLLGVVSGDSRAILLVIAMVGGGIGSPIVGVVVAWLMSITDYRSRTGVEWGAVGVTSALLLAWPLRLSLAALLVFSVMYAVAAIVAYRVVVALFEDDRQPKRLALKDVAVYGVCSLVIGGTVYGIFEAIEPLID